jgi:succinylarginine dihydrolase
MGCAITCERFTNHAESMDTSESSTPYPAPDRGDARVHCTATKAEVKKESKESSRRTNNVLADIFPQVKSHKYF